MTPDILVHNSNDPIKSIADAIYGDVIEKYNEHEYSRDRAILTPTLDDVNKVNEMMIGQTPGEEKVYLSSYTISKNEENYDLLAELYTPEILNSIKGS